MTLLGSDALTLRLVGAKANILQSRTRALGEIRISDIFVRMPQKYGTRENERYPFSVPHSLPMEEPEN